MNYPTLRGNQVRNDGCGRQAAINDARAFWQSRMTKAGSLARPPDLADLSALARDVRRTWPPAS